MVTIDPIIRHGLEGVIAAETRLSHIDGLAGELIIAGYALEDIAPYASFEEMLYLLWYDRLPTQNEVADFHASLTRLRTLHPLILEALREAADKQLAPMDALRLAAGLLSLQADSMDDGAQARLLVAIFPTIVAAYWRLRQGQAPISPRADLTHAANYLYMFDGLVPSDERVRALNTYLNTVIEHGFNASTFTARVIISTDSDMISAIVGAIGALKGAKHGGAPGPALDMVFEIAQPERAEAYLREKLSRGDLLMGFGHRVYKVRDPRADVLNTAAVQFFKAGEQLELYHLARHVESVALRLLEEYKPRRNLQTNVEFYTALVLHGIGLEADFFSPTFAIARVGGWTAHALEHRQTGRILRPLAAYTGERGRKWQALTAR